MRINMYKNDSILQIKGPNLYADLGDAIADVTGWQPLDRAALGGHLLPGRPLISHAIFR